MDPDDSKPENKRVKPANLPTCKSGGQGAKLQVAPIPFYCLGPYRGHSITQPIDEGRECGGEEF